MFKIIRKLRKDDRGATAIEYGLIAALVAVAAIGALTALGGSLQNIFTTAQTQLDTANTAANTGAGG
ncbi:MAG: Flp family type IVb pilin [Alphaproteobacteria bacterium]|nr:MAG: Flp family type IVb pilin [Alphaproteobacteria bacterium]